jgi:hypothetical protein
MHKIFDLREMDIEQLRALAEELNVKGFKKMEAKNSKIDCLIFLLINKNSLMPI